MNQKTERVSGMDEKQKDAVFAMLTTLFPNFPEKRNVMSKNNIKDRAGQIKGIGWQMFDAFQGYDFGEIIEVEE